MQTADLQTQGRKRLLWNELKTIPLESISQHCHPVDLPVCKSAAVCICCTPAFRLDCSVTSFNSSVYKRDEDWSRNVSRMCFWDSYWGRAIIKCVIPTKCAWLLLSNFSWEWWSFLEKLKIKLTQNFEGEISFWGRWRSQTAPEIFPEVLNQPFLFFVSKVVDGACQS